MTAQAQLTFHACIIVVVPGGDITHTYRSNPANVYHWRLSLVVTLLVASTLNWISTEMDERLLLCRLSIQLSHLGQLSLAIPLWVSNLSTGDGYGLRCREDTTSLAAKGIILHSTNLTGYAKSSSLVIFRLW